MSQPISTTSNTKMAPVVLAQQGFALHPAGVLFWPERQLAVVADLHLEKGSFFAMQGQMLPPHDSQTTLENLLAILANHPVEQVILLGDSFHDADGYYRLNTRSKALFETLCGQYSVIWVMGNHDGGFVPPNVRAVKTMLLQSIAFRHEAAEQVKTDEVDYEISGHFHPKAQVRMVQKRITRPCFIYDQQRMILPSFGVLTGGLDVHHPAVKGLFTADCHLSLLGEQQLYTLPFSRTSAMAHYQSDIV